MIKKRNTKLIKEKSLMMGRRVREIRKALNQSQLDFAESISIYNSYLSEIESGKANPGFDFFFKIATIHHVSLDYLFFGTGKMFADKTKKISADAPVGENRFIEEIGSIDDLVWLINHSTIFTHTAMGWAAKFFHDNKEMLRANVGKLTEKS